MIRKSLTEQRDLIRNRQISVSELISLYLQHIQEHDSKYRVFSVLSETSVEILAQIADRKLQSNEELGPLHGVPILIDDLIDVANLCSKYGSQAYADNVPETDSILIRRLKEAGAIILGKAQTSEFGVVIQESKANFISRSPWGKNKTSGGGASGIAVGLVQEFAAAAVGIDVCGNVFLPAAFSGVFTFMPTCGRIPLTPVFSKGMMFPAVTLLSKNVADCALLLNTVSGHSEADPISDRSRHPDYELILNRSIKPLKVAYSTSLWNAPIDENHRLALNEVISMVKGQGARVELARPHVRDLWLAWEQVFSASLYVENGERFEENPEKFGKTVTQILERGRTATATQYIQAHKDVLGFRLLLRNFFQQYDLLVTPAAGCVPFVYGTTPSNLARNSPVSNWKDYASMCAIGAFSGFPTAHLPVMRTSQGLPVGTLVIGKPGSEDLVLALCATCEQLL